MVSSPFNTRINAETRLAAFNARTVPLSHFCQEIKKVIQSAPSEERLT